MVVDGDGDGISSKDDNIMEIINGPSKAGPVPINKILNIDDNASIDATQDVLMNGAAGTLMKITTKISTNSTNQLSV